MSDKKRAKLVASRQAAGRPGTEQARSSPPVRAGRGADTASSVPIVQPLGVGSAATSAAALSRPPDGGMAAGEREKSDPIRGRRFWLAQVVRVGVASSYVWLRLIGEG